MITRTGTPTPVDYHLYPSTFTEARRVLRCPQRKITGGRTVHLDSRCISRARGRVGSTVLDVLGPPPGLGSLTVVVGAGMFDVWVLGGYVHVVLGSSWGNVLTVEPAAVERTSAELGPGVKAHVYGLPLDRISGDTARLRWFPSADDNHAHPRVKEAR